MNKRIKILIILGFFLLLAAIAYFLDVQALFLHTLTWIQGLGWIGVAAFILIYVLACVLFLPGFILTLGAGTIFGVVYGSIIVSVASTTGAACAFLAGRYFVRQWIENKIQSSPKFKAIDEAVAQNGWKIVGLTRLSPVFPFNLLNYAYGLTKVSFKHYVLASWIGMMPGTITYVYIGSLVGSLASLGTANRSKTPAEWAIYGIGSMATITVSIYVTRIAKKTLEEQI